MRILVVGGGSIGRRHAINAAEYGSVAVCDLDAACAHSVAKEAGGVALTTIAAALDWKPDAAVIAVPTAKHVDVADQFVGTGVPLLIEKPISHSDVQAEALLKRAAAKGCSIYIGCNMRYHPGPATLKQAIRRVGRPLYLRAQFGNYLPNMRPGRDYRELYCARRSSGGGVILDSIHEIDYAIWLLGPASDVMASAGRLSDLDIDVEDYATISATHALGARSEIHLDYLQQFKRRGCEIVGTEGTLIWTSEGKSPEALEVRLFTAAGGAWETLERIADVDANAPYRAMLRAFIDVAAGAGAASDSALLRGDEALASLRVCRAALDAVERRALRPAVGRA